MLNNNLHNYLERTKEFHLPVDEDISPEQSQVNIMTPHSPYDQFSDNGAVLVMESNVNLKENEDIHA